MLFAVILRDAPKCGEIDLAKEVDRRHCSTLPILRAFIRWLYVYADCLAHAAILENATYA